MHNGGYTCTCWLIPITLRDLLDRLLRTCAGSDQNTALMPGAGSGILETWKPAGAPDCGMRAAVDVHYLSTGGAWAAAIVAADAAFAHPSVREMRTSGRGGARVPGRGFYGYGGRTRGGMLVVVASGQPVTGLEGHR